MKDFKPFISHEKGIYFQVRHISDISQGPESDETTSFAEAAKAFYDLLNQSTVKLIASRKVEAGGKTYSLPSFKDINDVDYFVQIREYS